MANSSSVSPKPESIEVRAPNEGLGEAAAVLELSVSVGDTISQDAVLLVIEAEKVTVDVRSPAAGRVAQVLVAKNTTVHEADLLVILEPLAPPTASAAASAPAASASTPSEVSSNASSEFHASPWIRSLAREQGLELSEVRGTGRHGRILEEDLKRPARLASEPPSTNDVPASSSEPSDSRPLTRLQRVVARNLAKTWAQVPHVSQFDEADITELEAFRIAINSEPKAHKISLLPFIVKASACALAAFPEFNGSLLGENLILKRHIHIGIAVDTAGGLQVPVIQHADRLPLLKIAEEIARLAEAARNAKLTSSDVQDGTFTVSNLGAAGGTAFTPIINGQEVAILGVSKAELKPKWNGSTFVPRLMLPLSLSYDHRVINGVAGARFISRLGSLLSDLRRALL